METQSATERYVKNLKKEVNLTIKKAREYFMDKDPLAEYSIS